VCRPVSAAVVPTPNSARPLSLADAQRIRDDAYRAMCDELASA
jgi:hypothetical protein